MAPDSTAANPQYVSSFAPETAMPVQQTVLGLPDHHPQQRLRWAAMKDICIVA
jgi:hypothetical protein